VNKVTVYINRDKGKLCSTVNSGKGTIFFQNSEKEFSLRVLSLRESLDCAVQLNAILATEYGMRYEKRYRHIAAW